MSLLLTITNTALFKDLCSCRCVGDPHCTSYDGRKLHYQGGCLYVMARDGCNQGTVVSEPNFMVVLDNFRKQGVTKQTTWVYEVFVMFPADNLVSDSILN